MIKKSIYWPIYFFAILFFIKALYLAFYVTPLWDIPDETGHFSYARGIAEGHGVALLGEAKIESDILTNLYQEPTNKTQGNWIAQHPPFYYLMAAIPLKVGMSLSLDKETLFYLPRVVSALSGALLLLVLFQTLRTMSLEPYRSMLIAVSISFIPMVSHMSSGTNHDMTLFLFSAIMVFYLARFVQNNNVKDAYLAALWLTLAAGIKMTAWVVIPPVLLILMLEFSLPLKNWIKHVVITSAIALSVPVLWMARNVYYFSDPLYTASKEDGFWRLETPLTVNFAEFFSTQPLIDHFLLNFYGILGGIGTGAGELNWFQLYGMPRLFFSVLLLLIIGLLTIYILSVFLQAYRSNIVGIKADKTLLGYIQTQILSAGHTKAIIVIGAIVAITVFFYLFVNSNAGAPNGGMIRLTAISLILMSSALAIFSLINIGGWTERFSSYALLAFLFFTLIMAWQIYVMYLLDGRLRATHGRYFYPIMPFLIVAFAIAVKRFNIPALIIAVSVVLLGIMELEAYVSQAIPFYGAQ